MSTSYLPEILANLDYLIATTQIKSLNDEGFREYKKTILRSVAGNIDGITVGYVKEQLWQLLKRFQYPDDNYDILLQQGSSSLKLEERLRILVDYRYNELNELRVKNKGRSLRSRSKSAPVVNRRKSAVSVSGGRTTIKKNKSLSSGRALKRDPRHPKGRDAQPAAVPSVEIRESPCTSSILESSMEIDLEHEIGDHRQVSASLSHYLKEEDNADTWTLSSDRNSSPSAVLSLENATLSTRICYYKERYEKAEQDRKRTEKELNQIESLLVAPQDMKLLLSQTQHKVDSLTYRMQDRTKLRRFLNIDTIYNAASENYQLQSRLDSLKDELHGLDIPDGSYQPALGGLRGKIPNLDELLMITLGHENMVNPESISSIWPPLTSCELVQALSGAAICRWIFGTAFQTQLFAANPLLQTYRKLLTSWCGEESLANLDNAAHKFMIEDADYRDDMTSVMIKSFTSSLITALRPLLKPKTKRSSIDKLRKSLIRIATIAVEIRTDCLATESDYEVIWPIFESQFDEHIMEAMHSHHEATEEMVRLPICPGLRAFDKGKALVDYGPFKMNTAADLKPTFIFKSSVLLRAKR
ncbi:hypothetical protein E8E13_001659 [Curvularia kusanoi]|uniref:Uncharacterized protein n=1 Tax=Curvularia kusanoi TaxID=90978 RepID=A0A9P4T3L8_CURKU|nr:hypothetical protein E8E13_001659 [Curvularia kusanoi]